MSFSREYAHRPPIPTAEEILQDFDSTMKNKEFKDPVFVSHEDIFQEGKRGKLVIFFQQKYTFHLSLCTTQPKTQKFLQPPFEICKINIPQKYRGWCLEMLCGQLQSKIQVNRLFINY